MAYSLGGSSPAAAKSFTFPEQAAKLALIALSLVILVGLQPLTASDSLDRQFSEGDTAQQITFVLIFALAVGAGWAKRILAPSTLPPGVPLLLGWCLLSVTWSGAPEIAARRFILLSVMVATVSICVAVLGTERALRTLAITLIAIVAGNWIAIMVSDYSVHQGSYENSALAGDWRGLHPHKNIAGSVMALTALGLLFVRVLRSRLLQFGLLCCTITFLVFTRSKTSMGFLAISVVIGYAYHFGWPNSLFRVFSLIWIAVTAGILMLVAAFHMDFLTSMSGDTSLFTGRTEIWTEMISLIKSRPMLGFGYGSFWGTGDLSPMMRFHDSWTFLASHGHNGYLDVVATIGLVGLAVALAALAVIPIYSLLLQRECTWIRTLLFAWIIFCLLHNMFESSLLAGDRVISLAHFFAVSLIASLGRQQAAESS